MSRGRRSETLSDGEWARRKIIVCAQQCEEVLRIADGYAHGPPPERAAKWREYAATWSTLAFEHARMAVQP